MNKGVNYTGVISFEELQTIPGIPSDERIEKGPVAVIECTQEVPCNPCEFACDLEAISIGQQVTNLPKLDEEKCIGCGECLSKCPGFAIFKIHKNYSEKTSLVSFPYDYLPLPKTGNQVQCANREGEYITDGKVIEVIKGEGVEKTAIITVEVPKEYYNQARTILKRSL